MLPPTSPVSGFENGEMPLTPFNYTIIKKQVQKTSHVYVYFTC
jgi:hypothetical protein